MEKYLSVPSIAVSHDFTATYSIANTIKETSFGFYEVSYK